MCCCCEDQPIFFSEKEQTAKKEYQCVECEEKINVGERYVYSAGKWWEALESDEKVQIFRTCLACHADWQILMDIQAKKWNGEICACFGGLKGCVADMVADGDLPVDHPLVEKWQPKMYSLIDEECGWLSNGLPNFLEAEAAKKTEKPFIEAPGQRKFAFA